MKAPFEVGWSEFLSMRLWRFSGSVLNQHTLRSSQKLAGAAGLEPAASCVTGRRSNQLNYAPRFESQFPTSTACSSGCPSIPKTSRKCRDRAEVKNRSSEPENDLDPLSPSNGEGGKEVMNTHEHATKAVGIFRSQCGAIIRRIGSGSVQVNSYLITSKLLN